MPDKYDEAVEYLTKNPRKILGIWTQTSSHSSGCLFKLVCKDIYPQRDIGCLVSIRRAAGFGKDAETPELKAAILADERIPKQPENITVETLPFFAEWQREIDKELNRVTNRESKNWV